MITNPDLLKARLDLAMLSDTIESLAATLRFLERERVDLTGAAAIGFGAVLPIEIGGWFFDYGEIGLSDDGFVFEVLGRDATTVEDLLAMSLRDPADFAPAFGRVTMLGETVAHNPATYFLGSPLRVFKAPLSWLQADGQGVCPVDVRATARELSDLRCRLAFEDDAHARDFAALLPTEQHDRLVVRKAA